MRLLLAAFACLGLSAGAQAPHPAGPYLGQKPPGAQPELFAPGIVNQGLATRDAAFTPDGREFYFSVFMPGFRHAAIVVTRVEGGRWSEPEVAPFSRDPRWKCLEPCVSPDGKRFFFASDRPEDPASAKPGAFGIWVMARQDEGWGPARRLPASVGGTGNLFYPSVEADGTLYFLAEEGQGGWIMRSRLKDGNYQPAERMPAPFNRDPRQANPRIDPHGRFLLVPMMGRPDSLGGADYYGYFKKADGSWVGPVHLGPGVNSAAADEFSISLSPDGKYLFFGSDRALGRLQQGPLSLRALLAERTLPGNGQTAVWWVDASFLEALRRKTLGE